MQKSIASNFQTNVRTGPNLNKVSWTEDKQRTKEGRAIQSQSIPFIMLSTTCCILLFLCLYIHKSIAFQPPRSLVVVSSSCRYDVSVSAVGEDSDDDSRCCNYFSRRDILSRAVYGLVGGLTAATSISNVDRVNALDIPSFMISSEGDSRGLKGMPVPSKKLGGLPNKIRSVSKIMVRI